MIGPMAKSNSCQCSHKMCSGLPWTVVSNTW